MMRYYILYILLHAQLTISVISYEINSRVNAHYEMCHNALGYVIIIRIIVVMKGLQGGRKTSARHPRDRHVGELITVFRDNCEPARSCAIYPACIVPLVIACTASHTRERAYFGERRGERGEERERDRSVDAGTRDRVCVVNAGCVCSDDGCKQSRRCSLCNANA